MQPAAKRRKSRSVLQPSYQQLNDDEAFFPRREIPCTPPRATTPRRDATPVTPLSPRGNLTTPAKIHFPGDLENCPPGPSDQKKVQATCFTPSKSLARSPLKIMGNVPPPPQWEIPRTPTTRNPSPPPGPSDQKKVQATCFTPSKSLARSPLKIMGNVPPPPQWEIPRTPTTRNPSPPPGPSDQKKVQATCFTPSKSLARSPLKIMGNVPPPPQWEIPRTPTTRNPSPPPPLQSPLAHNESGTSQIVPPKSPGQPLLPHCPAESEAELRLPQGLVCTDTDLAYLQRLENLKKHDQLQKRLVELDKALRTTAEQKEQLQHTAEKVSTDLQEMKERYKATLSNVRTLQSTFEPKDSTHSVPISSSNEDLLSTGLSHTHLSRLRHMQQLMTVQLEKTSQEIERRVERINNQKQEVEKKRKEESLTVEALDKDLKSMQAEKREWEERVRLASDTQQSMTKQLEELQLQLEHTTTCQSRDQDHAREDVTEAEKRVRAEERLRCLVKRCDLYVKRHQLLKQLEQI